MRRTTWLAAIAVCAVGALPSARSASAFEANQATWTDDDLPVSYKINEAGSDDLSIEQLEALFAASFASWTEVPCTRIAVRYDGLTPTLPIADDEHVMAFVEESWPGDPMMLGATATTLLTMNPLQFTVDISFNGEFVTWQIGGGGWDLTVIDPQSVFTHEIGHFFGLGHSRDDGSATMAAAYLPDTGQRTLSHDDKAGICTLYPRDGSTGECDPFADACPTGSTCGAVSGWNVCIEERDGLEAPCSHSHINCQDTCVYTRVDLEAGFCTRQCTTSADCPDGICRLFGDAKVCRLLPTGAEEALESTEADGDDADTGTGFEFGVVEVPETDAADTRGAGDVAEATDGGTDGVADRDAERSGDDGCGCRFGPRRASGGPLLWAACALCLVTLGRLRHRSRRLSGTPRRRGRRALASCRPPAGRRPEREPSGR